MIACSRGQFHFIRLLLCKTKRSFNAYGCFTTNLLEGRVLRHFFYHAGNDLLSPMFPFPAI